MEKQTYTMPKFVNDEIRAAMNEELEEFEEHFMYLSPEEILKYAEDLHRYRAIYGYLKNHDLPVRCAVGFYAYAFIFPILKEHFNDWKNDSDEAIAEFLTTIGKQLFEDIRDEGETTDDVYSIVMSWKGEEEIDK